MATLTKPRTGIEQFLEVPGAKTTLPVSAAKKGSSADFVNDARKYFDNFNYQMGGDHALYYNLRRTSKN